MPSCWYSCQIINKKKKLQNIISTQYNNKYYPFSIDGSFGILFSSWVRRKSYPGNNNFDVLDIFHERCERYAAPFVWNTSHRNIFLLYHDHGSKLCGKCFRKIYYINLSELLSSMISSYYQLIIMVILGMYYPCAQLSSSISIKWSDAKMGANFIPSMDTLGAKDIKTRKQNHAKVHPPSKQGKIIVKVPLVSITIIGRLHKFCLAINHVFRWDNLRRTTKVQNHYLRMC